MIEKLNEAEKRYEQINERLSDPQIVSDQEQFRSLMKEHKQLGPIIEKFRAYKHAKQSVQEAETMLGEPLEPDFKELVEQEYKTGKENWRRFI